MNKFTIYAHNIIIEATQMAIKKALKFGVFVRKLTDYETIRESDSQLINLEECSEGGGSLGTDEKQAQRQPPSLMNYQQ